jgi:hypothetical protein
MVACQESFNIDELDTDHKIPVFEGSLTDEPGPYKVELYYAKSFNSKKVTRDIIYDARVTITYDNGASVWLRNSTSGAYYTYLEGFQGKIGNTYKLHVELNNVIYESTPIMLENSDKIDSLYAEAGKSDYVTYNGMGEMVIKTNNGIFLYVDVITKTNTTKYYKFDNIVISQKYFSTPVGSNYIRNISYPDYYPNIKSTVQVGENQIIKKHKLIFIPYINEVIPATEISNSIIIINMGWIVISKMSVISKETYQYYSGIQDQLKAGSQLFDPIATQIKGNIRCINDSNRMVLGIFNVYTQSEKYKAFYYRPGIKEIKTKNVTEPGPIRNDTSNIPPPYWINF